MNRWMMPCSVLAVTALVGCGSAGDGSETGNPASTYSADASPADPQPQPAPSGGFVDAGDPNADAGPAPILFYANTDDTLFTVDPNDLTSPLTTVGKFDCVGAPGGTSVMTDIAVSETGKLYGVSASAAWPLTIQNGTVHCDAKWPLPYDTHFNGLTFAPENTVAPNKEVLIASNTAGGVYEIDAVSGAVTQVGTLGVDTVTGKPWSLSGDMVFLANNGNPIGFATVRTCSSTTSCSSVDTLVEIDVSAVHPGTQSVLKSVRGKVNKGTWCTNAASPATFGSMFGIVAYQDKVYGYSRKGDFIEIHNDDGTGCLVQEFSNLAFAGAGINTLAPVVPPPPK